VSMSLPRNNSLNNAALASEPDSISIASAALLRELFLGSDMLTFVHVEDLQKQLTPSEAAYAAIALVRFSATLSRKPVVESQR
jgi:hypothetical protein